MGPDQGRKIGLQDPARDRHALGLADGLCADPVGRRVARLLPHGLVAPGAARSLRIRRVDDPFALAVRVDQLELVLEAGHVGRRRGELPGPASARELVRQPVAELVREADGRESPARVGELETELDHGSVSSVCKLTRRTVLFGQLGPFRTLGARGGGSYEDSSKHSRRIHAATTRPDRRHRSPPLSRSRGAAGATLAGALDDGVISACRNRSTGVLRIPATGASARATRRRSSGAFGGRKAHRGRPGSLGHPGRRESSVRLGRWGRAGRTALRARRGRPGRRRSPRSAGHRARRRLGLPARSSSASAPTEPCS